MRLSAPLRHAAWSGAAAVAAAGVLVGVASYLQRAVPAWTVVGWATATLLGVTCGARLVALHGKPGTAFLKTLGSCILARLFLFAGGTAWAYGQSLDGALAFLVGAVAGYLPTQALEMVWFARSTRDRAD